MPRLCLAALLLGACGSDDEDAGPANPIDLLADTNRSGRIEFEAASENAGEAEWNADHGAIFLANIDDDLKRCPQSTSDLELAGCNDAADEVLNGPDDLFDLAPLAIRAWPRAPDGASARLELGLPGAGFVRLFRRLENDVVKLEQSPSFDTADLRTGVGLAIEGKDILRDAANWDGLLEVTLIVESKTGELGRDTLQLRLSPVMTYHQLLPVEVIHATDLPGSADSAEFRSEIGRAMVEAGAPGPLHELVLDDDWTQDFFEPAYMSMPAPGGNQHVIWVYYRSANTRDPAPLLRAAGQVVFNVFRGKNIAGVQEFDRARAPMDDTFDSMGNTETIPPYELSGVSYPLGRLFRGSVELADQSFRRMLEAQRIQPPVYIPTDWLSVGHVDETITFVKADTPRGWAVLVSDPRLAHDMLQEQANGSAKMFTGLYWEQELAETSVSAVLADTEVMSASAEAVAEIDAQLELLKAETGITDAEIVRIPFLFGREPDGLRAYQPATVNGAYLSDRDFAAPKPHGPIMGGKDIFETQLERALSAIGLRVHFIETWDLYHTRGGEVHCGTNTTRKIPLLNWWETGR